MLQPLSTPPLPPSARPHRNLTDASVPPPGTSDDETGVSFSPALAGTARGTHPSPSSTPPGSRLPQGGVVLLRRQQGGARSRRERPSVRYRRYLLRRRYEYFVPNSRGSTNGRPGRGSDMRVGSSPVRPVGTSQTTFTYVGGQGLASRWWPPQRFAVSSGHKGGSVFPVQRRCFLWRSKRRERPSPSPFC